MQSEVGLEDKNPGLGGFHLLVLPLVNTNAPFHLISYKVASIQSKHPNRKVTQVGALGAPKF